VMPQYLISQAPGKVVLRNFEGFITSYDEPNDYTGHTVARPERPVPNYEIGAEGVYGLLSGAAGSIKPQGFDKTHRRNVDAAATAAPAGKVVWEPIPIQQAGVKSAGNGNGHNGNGHG
jgi:lysine 2,3-aminomutase